MAVMLNDGPVIRVWMLISTELERALEKHPVTPKDPLRRTAIICEEAGEALREAVDLTRPPQGETSHPGTYTEIRERLRHEIIQTGAMAFRMLLAMDAEDQEQKREKILS